MPAASFDPSACRCSAAATTPRKRLPADGDWQRADRRRREAAERVVVEVDDPRPGAGAPVDELDPDAVPVAADGHDAAAPVADADLGPRRGVHPAVVAAGAGARAWLAEPARAAGDAVAP